MNKYTRKLSIVCLALVIFFILLKLLNTDWSSTTDDFKQDAKDGYDAAERDTVQTTAN